MCMLVVLWKVEDCGGMENGAHLSLLDYMEERNNRQLEDLESLVEDILASLLHSFYIWTAAYLAPLPISYADFLVRVSFSS